MVSFCICGNKEINSNNFIPVSVKQEKYKVNLKPNDKDHFFWL